MHKVATTLRHSVVIDHSQYCSPTVIFKFDLHRKHSPLKAQCHI